MQRASTLQFLGGAGSVTGSNFLLESENFSALVDCGLFQGCDFCDDKNWEPFPFKPVEMPLLVVTHAHIDHIGRIPKLVRNGFRGRIISTDATKALAQPLLLDSMELLAREAERKGKEPLYDTNDIDNAMKLWEGVSYHAPMPLAEDFTLELFDAGHILGSAMARFSRGGRNVLFTGDLGGDSLLLPPRDSIAGANYLLIESVYGDRTHKNAEPEARRAQLARVISETAARGGTLLIPAFSTERTQDILFELRMLLAEKKIPRQPVFLDSPLAEAMTRVFLDKSSYFKPDIAARVAGGEDIFSFPELSVIASAAQSAHLARESNPKIIIAGSGMSNGGRVLAHEQAILPDTHSTLLIVGYQAAGSLGRQLIEGVKRVIIGGKNVRVHCRVEQNLGYSAHLDGPHLLDCAAEAKDTLEKAFVAMGEPSSSSFLVQRMRDYLGIDAAAPALGQSATLNL